MAPRMENPVDLGQGAWERLDLDWQIRGPLNPRIAQLEDRNGLWLSPMKKELGQTSGFRVLSKMSSLDGSVRTELMKRAEGSEFGLQTSKAFGKLLSDKDKRDLVRRYHTSAFSSVSSLPEKHNKKSK